MIADELFRIRYVETPMKPSKIKHRTKRACLLYTVTTTSNVWRENKNASQTQIVTSNLIAETVLSRLQHDALSLNKDNDHELGDYT